MSGPRTRTLAAAVLVTLALTGCGGDGGTTLPTLPTERPTLPSVTLPSVTLPTITLPSVTLPTVTLPTLPTVDPGATDAPTTTPVEPAPTPEEEDEVVTPTPEAEDTGSEDATSEDTTAEDTDAADGDGSSGWLWLLIGLGLLAAAGVVVALRRRRERAAWSEAVAEPVRDAQWLRDSLVPTLLAQGADGRAGTWAIGRPRVITLEQRLTGLQADAPDPETAGRVVALTAAVQTLRRVLDDSATTTGFGGAATTAALQQSQLELDEAARALHPSSPPPGADSSEPGVRAP